MLLSCQCLLTRLLVKYQQNTMFKYDTFHIWVYAILDMIDISRRYHDIYIAFYIWISTIFVLMHSHLYLKHKNSINTPIKVRFNFGICIEISYCFGKIYETRMVAKYEQKWYYYFLYISNLSIYILWFDF